MKIVSWQYLPPTTFEDVTDAFLIHILEQRVSLAKLSRRARSHMRHISTRASAHPRGAFLLYRTKLLFSLTKTSCFAGSSLRDFCFCFVYARSKPNAGSAVAWFCLRATKKSLDFSRDSIECRQRDLNPHVVAHNRF